MNQQVDAKIFYQNNFSMLELPYGRGNFSMLILLPNQDKSVDDILEIWNNENYNDWLSGLTEIGVELSIPRFKFKYEKYLNDYLKAMGLTVAFDRMNADFSKISDSQIYIDFVKHDSFIEVNEKGTEAAAVTTIGFTTTSADPRYYPFIANKPFVFIIKEKYTNSILFMGKVENPLLEE
jgi:serpin B